ncbi:FIST N-terminal domain-containing protein [Candidatus Berkiella aquae]|uniref:FIST C-terminal domain-containing protein n=1 Tax=Candidatus Berkiella aquae TaxID=295108 RepID=A0A0Q9YWX9_9GAMM|nr:FIST N-terminal domain-containing protein [Candidatus Berkiella aquae]MCS5711179.1 FIST C-terminal domain-containing protein [Candidatus Berkiella aquae]
MQVKTFHYKKGTGWSLNDFPEMNSSNTLILAFCAPEYFNNTKPFDELRKAYPTSQIAGCSTAGEIYNEEINDHSISVAITKFEKSTIQVITEHIENPLQSEEIGIKLGIKLNKDNLKSVIILSDGLTVNGSSLVEGLKSTLKSSVIITGGLAGDGSQFKNTWVVAEGKPITKSITAIGIYGEHLEVNYGSKGGWDIFGPERLITRSEGNVLYEIDGEPALEMYKKYLGEKAKELPSSGLLFPLAIREKPLSSNQVVRTILAIDENKQSLTFAGDIPQGWYAQLMKANFDRLIEGASIAGQLAASQIQVPNSLNLAISCVGRRLVLGERSEEEIEATLDSIGRDSPLVGFYSYGEISPSGLQSCDLHNQTMTLTSISER